MVTLSEDSASAQTAGGVAKRVGTAERASGGAQWGGSCRRSARPLNRAVELTRRDELAERTAVRCGVLAADERSLQCERAVEGREECTDEATPRGGVLDTRATLRGALLSLGTVRFRSRVLISPLMQPRVKGVYPERRHQDGRKSDGLRKP